MGEILHPRRNDGSVVDASFELTSVPVYELVFHHKAGARGSPRSENADYHEGLEILLERLSSIGGSILGISVDSSIARKLPQPDRELALSFPIEIGSHTEVPALRRDITRAQKAVARRADAKPGGGNDQKRIRITIALDRPIHLEELRSFLID